VPLGRTTKTSKSQRSDVKYQLLVFAAVFLSLFFVEYPPLFLLGYWSWGAVIHKVLSGVFLILNLIIAEFARKRLGFVPVPRSKGEGTHGQVDLK
jgi:hypothetical protein